MHKLLLLSVVAAALVAAPGATAAYNDTSCRAAAVSWTNDPCAGRQWGHTSVRAPQAWGVTQGAGVTVAVVDPAYGHGRVNAQRAVTQ